jgi:serine/threonine protein phosphatase PrpC
MEIRTYSETNVGKLRKNNEDAYFTAEIMIHLQDDKKETIHIIVVLDGMGGLEGGEIASSIAGKTYLEEILKSLFNEQSIDITTKDKSSNPKKPFYQVDIKSYAQEEEKSYTIKGKIKKEADGNINGVIKEFLNISENQQKTEEWLKQYQHTLLNSLKLDYAISTSNEKVNDVVKNGDRGMPPGTTLTSGVIYQDIMLVSNIGDSRAYQYKNDKIKRISKDHSYVQELVDKKAISKDEARLHPQKNIITRCIGANKTDFADHFILKMEVGDIYLFSTDGLHDLLSDNSIEKVIDKNRNNLEMIGKNLIKGALEKGGVDNITLTIAETL